MKPKLLFACVVCVIVFAGCGGVTFDTVAPTTDIPQEFKDRNFYPDASGLLRHHPEAIVGWVIYHEPGAEVYDRKTILLKKNYVPKLERIEEKDAKTFEGTVNNTVAAKGSYLSFAASLDLESVATFSINDRMIILVPGNDIPEQELSKEAMVKKVNPATRRYWVQGALVSSVDYTKLSKIQTNASGVIGPTLGFEGKVYNKKTAEIHTYYISLFVVDLDTWSGRKRIGEKSFNIEEFQPKGLTLLKFKESDFE